MNKLDTTVPVELLYGVGSCLAHIRGEVSRRLLDGQHHDGNNYRDTDTGQNPERTGPD